MLLSVAPSERFHSLDGSTSQKVGKILRNLNQEYKDINFHNSIDKNKSKNNFCLIPLFFACMALLLCRITTWNLWIPIAIAGILLHACSFLYVLAMALTVGAFGIVAILSLLDLLVILPLSDIYMSKDND